MRIKLVYRSIAYGGIRAVLLIAGLAVVAMVMTATLRAWLFQRVALETLKLNGSHETTLPAPAARAPRKGELLGRLEAPRLELSLAIVEGTEERSLSLGLGHIEGTALPGSSGNVGIAGHRDTFFRPLKDIRISDELRLFTAAGRKAYRVESTAIVGPKDVHVLDQSHGDVLTLVTCYPFYFLGAAPRRFIVRATPVLDLQSQMPASASPSSRAGSE